MTNEGGGDTSSRPVHINIRILWLSTRIVTVSASRKSQKSNAERAQLYLFPHVLTGLQRCVLTGPFRTMFSMRSVHLLSHRSDVVPLFIFLHLFPQWFHFWHVPLSFSKTPVFFIVFLFFFAIFLCLSTFAFSMSAHCSMSRLSMACIKTFTSSTIPFIESMAPV